MSDETGRGGEARFGWDAFERCWFDREQPTNETCPDRGLLYGEADPYDLHDEFERLSVFEAEARPKLESLRALVEAVREGLLALEEDVGSLDVAPLERGVGIIVTALAPFEEES